MYYILVWYNPKKNVYYHRFYKGHYHSTSIYQLGYVNQYNHVIVDIIDIYNVKSNFGIKHSLKCFLQYIIEKM